MKLKIKQTKQEKRKRSFRRLYRIYLYLLRPFRVYYLPSMLFVIPPRTLQPPASEILDSYIRLGLTAGYQVKVRISQQQTSDEHGGWWSIFEKGKLKFRTELKIKKELVESIRLLPCLQN